MKKSREEKENIINKYCSLFSSQIIFFSKKRSGRILGGKNNTQVMWKESCIS
jgi:hypothetical protein